MVGVVGGERPLAFKGRPAGGMALPDTARAKGASYLPVRASSSTRYHRFLPFAGWCQRSLPTVRHDHPAGWATN